MLEQERIEVEELQDYTGPIDKVLRILTKLKQQYGSKAIIELDAGHNNVSVNIVRRKKKPPKEKKEDELR